jgi:hypothetical protein
MKNYYSMTDPSMNKKKIIGEKENEKEGNEEGNDEGYEKEEEEEKEEDIFNDTIYRESFKVGFLASRSFFLLIKLYNKD